MTAPARSVFAEPLAQVEDALVYLESITLSLGPGERTTKLASARAALDLIEQRASELEERVLLDLAQEMFPDFDFSGCYDADDLRQHLKGQVSSAIEQRATGMEKALETLYAPGTHEEIRARFQAAEDSEEIPECFHSKVDWKCVGCLWGQLERSEYVIADYRAALSAREEAQ